MEEGGANAREKLVFLIIPKYPQVKIIDIKIGYFYGYIPTDM